MLYFLSSAARLQYAEDILRALALPSGARLRFRYDQSLVHGYAGASQSEGLLRQITTSSEKFTNSEGLICFLDSKEKRAPVVMYPCRKVRVISLERFGPILMCFLEVGDFCYAENARAFTNKVSEGDTADVPKWLEGDDDPRLQGSWVFEGDHCSELVLVGRDFSTFAHACDRIAKVYPFFAGSEDDGGGADATSVETLNPFWHVSLYDGDIRADGLPSPPRSGLEDGGPAIENGEYLINSGAKYTLRIIHYYPLPGKQEKEFSRTLRVDISGIVSEGPKIHRLQIKSEYDVKDIVFEASFSPSEKVGFIDLELLRDRNQDLSTFSEISLPIRIAPNWMSIFRNVALIGSGLVLPALIASSYRDGFEVFSWQVFIILISGIVGGLAAVFGLRKSI